MPHYKIILAVILAALTALTAAPAWGAPDDAPFPVFYRNAAKFRQAIEAADQRLTPLSTPVSGLTLPHHLLAMDIIAGGLSLLRGQRYDRILLLSPDHFGRGATPFSVPRRDFLTCLGPAAIDRAGVERLLAAPQVSASNLFSHEHGVRAILPFIAHYFPQTPVLPISLRSSSTRADWDALAEALLPLLSDRTLMLQSTDFSHYLNWAEAVKRDRETLKVLAANEAELVESLRQPDHLDSRAAQYIQMKCQNDIYQARPTVIANANSSEYAPPGETPPAESTSYIAALYSAENFTETPPNLRAGTEKYFFAGDFFSGRYLRPILENAEPRQRFVEKIRQLTAGAPLIINLEGVLAPQCPPPGADEAASLPPPQWRLCLPQDVTLTLMRDINVAAASLANNHSFDYGPAAYKFTKKTLNENKITTLERNAITEFKHFAIAALTDVDNSAPRKRLLLSADGLAYLREAPLGKPLFAFIHWGQEGHPSPGRREKYLASLLQSADLIIGHHPHRAGKLEADADGIIAWSLGNFLFDQPAPQADGALLELRFFPQGTFWARQIALGNLYNSINSVRSLGPD